MTSLRPWPVMVLTPVLGEAATTSCPPWRRMGAVFEPIRPVPPITTIFMVRLLPSAGSLRFVHFVGHMPLGHQRESPRPAREPGRPLDDRDLPTPRMTCLFRGITGTGPRTARAE